MAKYIKGMYKDTSHIDQPEGTWRYAKNAMMNHTDGAISNEHGNYKVDAVSTGFTVIGSISTTDDRIILFSVNTLTGRSEIGILNNDSYSAILNLVPNTNVDVDLKFSIDHPIEGEYKIDAQGELLVYWTDDFNPPRALNVTRQEQSPMFQLYGVDPNTSSNPNYIDRLNLFPHSGPVPHITLSSINSGGGLETAAYYLALAYVDIDHVQTNYVTVNNPIFIVDDLESVLPIERYDGSEMGTQTGKSITWDISNLNKDYKYVRPAVVRRRGGTDEVFQLNDIEILGDTHKVTFTGVEGFTPSSVEDVLIGSITYDTAKTISQLDGILYVGNLTVDKDIGYQPYANAITLHPRVKKFQNFDAYELSADNLENGYIETAPLEADRDNGYRSILNTYKFRGYMRDEIYAFYIAFILNDGSMSYAYHIPGRAPVGTDIDSIAPLDDNLDALAGSSGKTFQFIDTSASGIAGTNNMNYWENANEFYPQSSSFDVLDGETGVVIGNTLQGEHVRHHHFPSNDNDVFKTITDSNSTVTASAVITKFCVSFGYIESGNGDISDEEVPCDSNDPNQPEETQCSGSPGVWDANANDRLYKQLGTCDGSTETCDDGCDEGEFAMPALGQVVTIYWDGPGLIYCNNYEGQVVAVGDGKIVIDRLSGDAPNTYWTDEDKYYGCIKWHTQTFESSGGYDNEIQALGFDLENIKVPTEIADKVQGFRVYYAERTHEQKTVIGQNAVIPMQHGNDALGTCSGQAPGRNQIDFWRKFPFALHSTYYPNNYQVLAFHDFHLLRTRNSLSPATHLKQQYEATFLSFKGAGVKNEVGHSVSACQFDRIRSSMHFGLRYNPPITSTASKVKILKERCKTYISGDTIFDARDLGFGYRINNNFGESCIALGLKDGYELPAFSISHILFNALETPDVGVPMSFGGEVEKLHIVNLHAFKSDVYNSIDTQNLIWTGFEVTGNDFKNFVAREEGATYNTENTSTGKEGIFGGDTFICRYGWRSTLRSNWSSSQPFDYRSGFYSIVESPDNINFRHETGGPTVYFPGSPAHKLLYSDTFGYNSDDVYDLTKSDNIKYNADYSEVNIFNPAFPLPLKDVVQNNFSTRTHRSAKSDPGELIDNFRIFLANQYKDLPKNRGELWKIAPFNNLLYFHMEDSLFRTKGKQSMQLEDGTTAFIGDGDIFTQDPDELIQTEAGYGGTSSQWAALTTRYGYFFADARARRVFLVKDQIHDISNSGMESWFRENMKWALESYGLKATLDNPITGLGFHAVWDENYERYILTKRELIPTDTFTDLYNYNSPPVLPAPVGTIQWSNADSEFQIWQGRWVSIPLNETAQYKGKDLFTTGGWTLSYYPELNVWVSFHDYVPYHYSHTAKSVYSYSDGDRDGIDAIWKHSQEQLRGQYYGVTYPFELEGIHNEAREDDKVFSNISYVADVFAYDSTSKAHRVEHNAGFNKFFVYTTHQISGEATALEYMMNTRRIGNEWKINKFRDMAQLTTSTDSYYVGPHTGSNYGIPGANVTGSSTSGVVTNVAQHMFNVAGMNETVNSSFINSTKAWNSQKKFVDKFLGFRLIYDNLSNKLVNLYSTSAGMRKYHR